MRELTDVIKNTPITVQKSVRPEVVRAVTSHYAGKVVPIKAFPLLREDRISRANINVNVEMTETALPLMNGIAYTARAWFIPFLAFDRFEGSLDRMNRSYKKQPDKEGGDIVPFFETVTYNISGELFRAMGLHAEPNAELNSSYTEAYNVMINHMYKLMSNKLPQREKDDLTLAACPWKNTAFRHIVADFDQAMIDGEVPLSVADAALPLVSKSLGTSGASHNRQSPAKSNGIALPPIDGDGNYDWTGEIWAELQDGGLTLSLSNIEMAKKTAAFAKMRKAYDGIDDDELIDMLMEGIRIPDIGLSQPILLDQKSTIVGMNQRWASDAGNLDQSVTTGLTSVNLTIRTPPMNTGGIILITGEAVPEQLFERQKDVFLHTTDPDELPSFTRDYLDPEKVSIVPNDFVDVLHSVPEETFGYAPLNHEWKRNLPNIGGKYMRQVGDPFDENRQKIWSNEQTDPDLTSDFYLATNIHHKVFKSSNVEPFEVTALGSAQIVGNTVFGQMLEENSDDFQILTDQVDTDRIDQPEEEV